MKKNEEDAEEERKEEEEAKRRKTFDPINQVYDDRKRIVTDLQECIRVILPKQLPVTEEAMIELRRDVHSKVYEEHRRRRTKEGEQTNNMSEVELRGLRSLLLRIKKGEIIIMKTDKSGKFCIVSVADYLEMGQVHIKKDLEVSRADMIATDKTLNGNSIAWCKIRGTGAAHGHEERVMTSKTSKSENSSNLYLMYKDHKVDPGKTRPVVTGCTSNTRAFSNSVSNLLEAVANCSSIEFESISGEDILSKKDRSNEKVKKVLEKWEERRRCKIRKRCTKCALEEILPKNKEQLYPEGRNPPRQTPIGVAPTGPTRLEGEKGEEGEEDGGEKLANRIGKEEEEEMVGGKDEEKIANEIGKAEESHIEDNSLLPEGWKQQVGAEEWNEAQGAPHQN